MRKNNFKKLLEDLFKLSCAYNQDVDKNGKCYSKKCMVAANPEMGEKYVKKCKAWKRIKNRKIKLKY